MRESLLLDGYKITVFSFLIICLFSIVSCSNTDRQKQKNDNITPSETLKTITETEVPVENPVVKIATTEGDIWIELDLQNAPVSVENFLGYVNNGFYDGNIFHRVIKDFVVQGGGITAEMVKKSNRPPIRNESYNKLRNKRGTIAMARFPDPDSATCQFFINLKDNPSLDFDGSYGPGYAVFGSVVKGMEIVDRIGSVKTEESVYYDEKIKRNVLCKNVPVELVVIVYMALVEDMEDDFGK